MGESSVSEVQLLGYAASRGWNAAARRCADVFAQVLELPKVRNFKQPAVNLVVDSELEAARTMSRLGVPAFRGWREADALDRPEASGSVLLTGTGPDLPVAIHAGHAAFGALEVGGAAAVLAKFVAKKLADVVIKKSSARLREGWTARPPLLLTGHGPLLSDESRMALQEVDFLRRAQSEGRAVVGIITGWAGPETSLKIQEAGPDFIVLENCRLLCKSQGYGSSDDLFDPRGADAQMEARTSALFQAIWEKDQFHWLQSQGNKRSVCVYVQLDPSSKDACGLLADQPTSPQVAKIRLADALNAQKLMAGPPTGRDYVVWADAKALYDLARCLAQHWTFLPYSLEPLSPSGGRLRATLNLHPTAPRRWNKYEDVVAVADRANGILRGQGFPNFEEDAVVPYRDICIDALQLPKARIPLHTVSKKLGRRWDQVIYVSKGSPTDWGLARALNEDPKVVACNHVRARDAQEIPPDRQDTWLRLGIRRVNLPSSTEVLRSALRPWNASAS